MFSLLPYTEIISNNQYNASDEIIFSHSSTILYSLHCTSKLLSIKFTQEPNENREKDCFKTSGMQKGPLASSSSSSAMMDSTTQVPTDSYSTHTCCTYLSTFHQRILQHYEVHRYHMQEQPRSTGLILPVATPIRGQEPVSKCSCLLSFKLTIWGIQVFILSTPQKNLVTTQMKATTSIIHLHANFHYILYHLTCFFTITSWIIFNIN